MVRMKLQMYKLIDNFLPKDRFKRIQDMVFSDVFPYYYYPQLNPSQKEDELSSYFTHTLFTQNRNYVASDFYNEFKLIEDILDVKALIRMKVNLYPRGNELETHALHSDRDFEHKGCILSMNTCDGGTILHDGTKIDSIENRALLFDPNKLHASTNCTDTKVRINIILNYF